MNKLLVLLLVLCACDSDPGSVVVPPLALESAPVECTWLPGAYSVDIYLTSEDGECQGDTHATFRVTEEGLFAATACPAGLTVSEDGCTHTCLDEGRNHVDKAETVLSVEGEMTLSGTYSVTYQSGNHCEYTLRAELAQ